MLKFFKRSSLLRLLGSSAALLMASNAAMAQNSNCELVNGVLPDGCIRPGVPTVVVMPVGANTELARRAPAGTGFAILLDGVPVGGDRKLADQHRLMDIALEAADIQIKYDGLGATPRLDLQILGPRTAYSSGDTITFASHINYPDYVTRGEVRIIDLTAQGGPRTVAIVPISPNGQTQYVLPQGGNFVAVHRVYDANGRYDETFATALNNRSNGAQNAANGANTETGEDNTAFRRIPVYGGSITVSGTSVTPGSMVQVLGQTLRADANGRFVLNRVLPAGNYGVNVNARANGRAINIERDVEIPRSEWFYVGVADATVSLNNGNVATTGQVGFYVNGRTQNDYSITAAVNTGEGELGNLLSDLNKTDPRSLLLRIDPDDLYPTYGDDSTAQEDAMTSGKFYMRVERDGNYLMWGNYRADINGGHFIRNERTLYGAQGVWRAQDQTENGDARAAVSLYAAQPENLAQRDIFVGTGGSIYFTRRQDISLGSETLSIVTRDKDTGRILERTTLIEGQDYNINHMQGVITLTHPLTASSGGGLVVTSPGGEQEVQLVAQYEYTPTIANTNEFSYGGRAEAWLTNRVRLGVSGNVENTGTTQQQAISADLRYQVSEGTWAQLDYAQTNGTGFGNSYSTDGGLIFDDKTAATGAGHALRAEAHVDFADMGLNSEGALNTYFENRTVGFATLDTQVTAATGDETLWGINATGKAGTRLDWSVYYDDYSNNVGEFKREGGVEAKFALSDKFSLSAALENISRNTSADAGNRLDGVVRLTYSPTEKLSVYGFRQGTISVSGLSNNNRYGAGLSYNFDNGWGIDGEVSAGTLGFGSKIMASYNETNDRSVYFGYELAPGREMSGVTLNGQDQGRFVIGGRRRINDKTVIFGENNYDIFGSHRSLTSSYGVEYAQSSALSYSIAYEGGDISDAINGDFNRNAVSFGVRYIGKNLSAQGRFEYRRERGLLGAVNRDADSYLVNLGAKYKIDNSQRLLFSLNMAKTDAFVGSANDGTLIDGNFGYALRPVNNDRLNILVRYRYLQDMYGQQINGATGTRPRQISHVFSLDAEYDLNQQWSIGAKIGGRLAQTSPDGMTPLTTNNAVLAVVNARYHVVHNWDLLLEARSLTSIQEQSQQFGVVAAAYRHMGNNIKLGAGYNFGQFSDDLTNLTTNDHGAFINLVAKF